MDYRGLYQRLTPLYDEGEAKAIVRWVLEESFGMTAADILCGKVTQLSSDDQQRLEKIVRRLEQAEPVQYVLGEAPFMGRAFHVERGVLIPRPETEDLCEWIISSTKDRKRLQVLDIGTGSGCIAVTLAMELAGSEVTAWDLSETALVVAQGNARRWDAEVSFVKQDVLQPPADKECWDIIVSNPPYVGVSERDTIHRNVMDYEPEEALFVSESDPVLFYRQIGRYAIQALKPGGSLYLEINPRFVAETTTALRWAGFRDVVVHDDRHGKIRMMKTLRP